MDALELVSFLLRPDTYPEPTLRVELVETHISWVFLTDRHAYKLKKPVRFEFLDFSTVELRRRACEDELRLNRRLAADVYLDVVAVTADLQGALSLGGPGTPVDWLVKMRRLPVDRSLDRLIAAGAVPDAAVDRIAAVLADFASQAPPLITDARQLRAAIERHVQANAAELGDPQHGIDGGAVQRVCAAQLRFLLLRAHLFDARVDDGRIIEGHGDLRPEHIYFEEAEPVIIDCIEFSRELRTLDVADELGFLAMECDRLGAAEIEKRIVGAYEKRSGDQIPPPLLHFYKSYRACVRAKVTALRIRQAAPSQQTSLRGQLRAYLEIADHHAREMMPPLMLMVRGLMGSGKSTLAAALADTLQLTVLSTDAIRRRRHAAPADAPAYGAGIYSADERRHVYQLLLCEAGQQLAQGASVVIDGTFLSNELRHSAVELSQSAGARLLIVTCYCPEEVARQRIAARNQEGRSVSDARPELLAAQQAEDEPMADDLPHLCLDTTHELSFQVEAVLRCLTVRLSAVGQ